MEKQENHLLSGFHFRGRLPHLKSEGATYFVTFRLADSLPANVIAQLKEDRALLVQNAMGSGRPLTWREERELFLWYSNAVDGLLDASTGSCWLARHEIATLVAWALCFFDSERYEIGAWVLMPNHVHVMVTPLGEWTVSQILHTWKSYTAKGANRILQRVGKFWQTESFDHRIRSDDELAATLRYVTNNPVKAGFAMAPKIGGGRAPVARRESFGGSCRAE